MDGLLLTSTPLRTGDSTFGRTVCTTVTYVNGPADSANHNGLFDWSLQDPYGASVTPTPFGSDTILSAGDLAPRGRTSGDVCVADDKSMTGQFVVLYEPITSFSAARAAWTNTVS
ncbi:MAG: hypothetical protein OJJ54_20765 [Pseudonocardia sp.]|nr:hypothetical protein [Pseudonocardia sp.]